MIFENSISVAGNIGVTSLEQNLAPLKILFVHPPEGNAYEFFLSFVDNKDCEIELLSKEQGLRYSILDRVFNRLKIPSDIYSYNKLLKKRDLVNIDIIIIVKGTMIRPWTLRQIKKKYKHIKIVSWSQDDMYAWHNRSLFYMWSLPYYDLVTTTKSYNVGELKSIGARRIIFHHKAYSKRIHKPVVNTSSNFAHDVVFIGSLEKERYRSMCFLASNGVFVNVYSDDWHKFPYKKKVQNLTIHKGGLYGNDYAEAITNSKVTLCFLRKMNRDLQTSRSIEIPACGGCMLAEYTSEHSILFKADQEAIFFRTDHELLEKVDFLLKNDEIRKNIAFRGHRRCLESGYSYDDLANNLIKKFRLL